MVREAQPGHSVVPATTRWETLALTASASTTAGFLSGRGGRIFNESGGQLVITFYVKNSQTGTVCAATDVDPVTIPDDDSADIPTGLFGAAQIYPVLSTGTANVDVCIKDGEVA